MKMHESPTATGSLAPVHTAAVPARSWYALTILTLIYSCHFLDRMMMSIIIEPARIEFGLSDSQIGLLTGLAYGATFAVAGIPLGMLIDRVNRVRLLAVLVSIWSGMTAMSGVAQSYWQLLLARMGVGGSEAGGSPASLSLISDLFPPNKRSTAVGVFFMSNAVGAILAIFIGGFVASRYGWRTAMFIAGVPGLILGLVLFATVREPKRGAMDTQREPVQKAPSLREVLKSVTSNPALVHMLAGIAISSASVATIGSWLAPFVMRFHGYNLKEAGFSVALASGFCGAMGSVLGGLLSDRLASSGARRRMDLCMWVCLLATGVAAAGLFMTVSYAAVGLLSLTQMIAFVVFPAAFGSMLSLTSTRMRGTTAATMQVVTNLVGYGMGPFMVGVFSDLYGGGQSLRLAMLTVICICFPWASVHFLLAARAVQRQVASS